MMKKIIGAGLIEYAIILSLLSLGVIGVYFSYGQEINNILNQYLSVYTGNNTVVNNNAKILSDGSTITMPPETVAPPEVTGPLGGTPTQPVSQCTNSSCDLDFGSFFLSGVPENFGEFVSTSGSSGGIDKLCDLISQISDQIKTTNPEDSVDLRDLSNLGHFISDFSEKTESIAKSCLPATSTNQFCVADKLDQTSSYVIPSNIASLLPNFNSYKSGKSIFNTLMLMDPSKSWTSTMTRAVYSTTPTSTGVYPVDHYASVPEYTSSSSPGMKFSEIYNKLKSSSLSAEQMSVVDKLYQNISKLASSQKGVTESNYSWSKQKYYTYEVDGGDRTDAITTVYSPQTAKNVDLKSALICVTGKRYDSGSECQK